MSQPAVFLDRDGTLMHEVHYCKDPALVRLIPGAREALLRLQSAGFRLVIITNQSGIARGMMTAEDFQAVQWRLLELLGSNLIDATYMCPDGPDAPSERRKPAPGMVFDAVRDLELEVSRSWFIGDRQVDVQCGLNAGARSILVRTGHGHGEDAAGAHFVAKDIASAADFILSESGAS